MSTAVSSATSGTMVSPPPPNTNGQSSVTQFACNASGCNEVFPNSAKLAVHKQKHQMTLKLGPSKTALNDILPVDQTPTPTKFLQFGKELGIFDELNNNNHNPFDSEFKEGTQKEIGKSGAKKALKAGIPGLQINNARPKTSNPNTTQFEQLGQPVHVITLTPTLSSPAASLAGAPFFVPHIPSPQALLPSGLHIPSLGGNSPLPGSLISPSIMSFSPVHFAAVEAQAQRAILAQAFMNAAANASQAPTSQTSSMDHMGHIMRHENSFPTHTVSVPVASAPTPPQTAHSHLQNETTNVVTQRQHDHQQQQRHIMQQQDELHHMDVKPPFPSATSVITQAPQNHLPPSHQQPHMLPSLNETMRPQFMAQQQHPNQMNQSMHQQSMQHFISPPVPSSTPQHNMGAQNMGTRANSHPNLTHTNSEPLPHSNSFDMGQHPMQGSDTKKILKAALTGNKPMQTQSEESSPKNNEKQNKKTQLSMSVSTSGSSTSTTKTGRRRGRASSNLDPDEKRQRFLERNRAAASRCRAKKKVWVVDLEIKAKELNNSNVCLQSEVVSLREEVASLKQLLLAHRDCPITRLQQQKLQTAGMSDSVNVMVSNPVAAAASLLGLSTANSTNATDVDVKPPVFTTASNYHTSLTHTNSSGSIGKSDENMSSVQTSVLVNTKMESVNYDDSDLNSTNNTSSSTGSVSS